MEKTEPTELYVSKWLDHIARWVKAQSDAKLDRDISNAMKSVRAALEHLGLTPEVSEICNRMDAALRESLAERYHRQAAETFFEQFVKRGIEAEGAKVPVV